MITCARDCRACTRWWTTGASSRADHSRVAGNWRLDKLERHRTQFAKICRHRVARLSVIDPIRRQAGRHIVAFAQRKSMVGQLVGQPDQNVERMAQDPVACAGQNDFVVNAQRGRELVQAVVVPVAVLLTALPAAMNSVVGSQ